MTATPASPATASPPSAGSPDFAGSSPYSARNLWLVCAVTGVGAVLRLIGLDWQSLWMDEVSSLRNALAFGRGGIGELASVDQVAPLHSIVLWLSTSVGGWTETSARMPSALAGIAIIPLTYAAAARMLGSARVALLSAGLVAISPFALYYAQEARMYALMTMAAMAYVVVVWPIVRRPLSLGELVLLTLITLVGLGMHHYMALISASFGLFLLAKDRKMTGATWAWTATQLIAAAVFAYWLYLTADYVAGGSAGNEKPGFLMWTPYALYTFVVGYSFGPSTVDLAGAGPELMETVVRHAPQIAIIALATAAIGWRALQCLLRLRNRLAALWLFMWLLIPIALSILAATVTNIHFNTRYVVHSFPALMIILAVGLADLPWRAALAALRSGGASLNGFSPSRASFAFFLPALLLLGCMATATANYYFDPRYSKTDARSLAAYLRQAPAGTLLVSDNIRVEKVLHFYRSVRPPAEYGVEYRPAYRKTPEEVWRDVERALPEQSGETWLIEYRSWEADPDHLLRRKLDEEAELIETLRWPGTSVRRYRTVAGRRAIDDGHVATKGAKWNG